MDAARIQAKINAGYRKAAARVAFNYDVYRPNGPIDPLLSANKFTTIPAAFTVHSSANFNFGKPSDFTNALFHCLADVTTIQIGDYFVNTDYGTWFLAARDALVPPLAVSCNRTLTISRRGTLRDNGGATVTKGAVEAYGAAVSTADGPTPANEPLMQTWPASVLKGSRGLRGDALPGDVGQGMFSIILPALDGINLRPSDIIEDDLGNFFNIQIANRIGKVWAIEAQQAIV